jgi:hypothetical protein
MKKYIAHLVIALAVALTLGANRVESRSPAADRGAGPGNPNLQLSANPATLDQITHNKSNIATTVDNWGYIGGYEYYGRPSGEWPRGSGHSYLAEMLYWMGATTVTNDTLVADSYDDFEAVPMPVNGSDEYRMYLSTDSTRFHNFNPTDTVGIADGTPARGWRVWNADSAEFVYNRPYNSLSSAYKPGGPTSLQDSHYRFRDNALGSPVLGVDVTQSIYSWNYCYNENFIFVELNITNNSGNNYTDFAMGIYADFDVGGPDGSGENGRLMDMVGFDSTESLAWTYDVVGRDPGWGQLVKTGFMGTKLLETPLNIGMTSFRTDDWAFLPPTDEGKYAFMTTNQFDQSLPPTDQFYVQCVKGINLTAGSTVRVVFAIVAGQTEQEFRDNAALAQELYNNFYVGPQPPTTPVLTARSGDRKNYLSWTDTSEVGIDPLSGQNDFVGYKLYRSSNQGRTWGEVIHNTGNDCLTLDYEPILLATVNSPGDPIPHTYIDTGLTNGVDYWYCLVAFDNGDTTVGVDPLQSGFGLEGLSPNVVKSRPTSSPAGHYDAMSTVVHTYTGTDVASDGGVFPEVFDKNRLTGAEYRVVFEDQPDDTYWHLIDAISGDTVLDHQTKTDGDPSLFPVADGMRVVVTNGDREPRGAVQTGFGGADTTLSIATWYGPAIPNFTGDNNDIGGDAHYRSTFELRYTGDSTRATHVLDGFYSSDTPYWVPLELWNTTTNERVSMAVYDFEENGTWEPYDLIVVVNYPYNGTTSVTPTAFPYHYSWMFELDAPSFAPVVGDVFTLTGAPMNSPADVFTFKVDGINAAAASVDMKNIKVVPNPYFAASTLSTETGGRGQSFIDFTNLPEKCTVRIYTLAGDLIQTIDHTSGDGSESWDLLTSNRQQVASGMYVYHVDSQFGTRTGRFAVIK